MGEIAHAAEQPSGNARRAARAAGDLRRAVIVQRQAENARPAPHDQLQFFDRVEIQPHRNAEPVAQRIGQQPEPRRRRHKRELRQINLHRPRRRTFADDQVKLVILHRRIEDFLDRRVTAGGFRR